MSMYRYAVILEGWPGKGQLKESIVLSVFKTIKAAERVDIGNKLGHRMVRLPLPFPHLVRVGDRLDWRLQKIPDTRTPIERFVDGCKEIELIVYRDMSRTEHDDFVLNVQPLIDPGRAAYWEAVPLTLEIDGNPAVYAWKVQPKFE